MERNFVYEVAGDEDVTFRGLKIEKDKPLKSNVRIPALEAAVEQGLLKCNYMQSEAKAEVIAPLTGDPEVKPEELGENIPVVGDDTAEKDETPEESEEKTEEAAPEAEESVEGEAEASEDAAEKTEDESDGLQGQDIEITDESK